MSEDTNPFFISINQAAERLGVSHQTVRRWIDDGRVPFVKIGMSVRIPQRWFHKLAEAAMAELKSTANGKDSDRSD